MLNRAAIVTVAIALALVSSAAFGITPPRFSVGAVVVRSATVISWADASMRDEVHVQVASRGIAMPMILAANGLKPLSPSGAAHLSARSSGDVAITLVF
jgi:pyrimidine deaminase RibD-like protein